MRSNTPSALQRSAGVWPVCGATTIQRRGTLAKATVSLMMARLVPVVQSAVARLAVVGRGMQFEADEAERLILAGITAGPIMLPSQTVAIMRTLDTIRAQIGLKYPSE